MHPNMRAISWANGNSLGDRECHLPAQHPSISPFLRTEGELSEVAILLASWQLVSQVNRML
jgi:hypothetical protein